MTYQELKELTKGQTLPLSGKNTSGENVIIEHRIPKQGQQYFQLTTAQHNGWTRINYIYEDGSTDELYSKRGG